MHKKIFFFTAILVVSVTILFAQPHPGNGDQGNQGNSSASLVFSPTSIPGGTYGSSYKSLTLKVSGGKEPYSFSLSGGAMPAGMNLSTDGIISGVPTAAGSYSFTVTVIDHSRTVLSGSKGYTLVVAPASLVVTAIAATKQFGSPDPVFSYIASGFLNGDNSGIFNGSLSRVPGENVGSYPITRGSLGAGINYSIIYTGNFLTITHVSQHITWGQDLLVGCNNTTKVNLNATASSGLPVIYSVSDANVASVSGNVLTLLNPGTAVVTATQPGNANYGPAPAVTDTLVYHPVSLISQHWSDAIFFDNSSGDYVQWQWYKNGQAVPGAINPFYSDTPTLNGQYYVIATNNTGRQIQSCTLTITAGAAIAGGIRAHPNPINAGGSVVITGNYSNPDLQGAILQVVDINGKIWQQLANIKSSVMVTMPSAPGIYIINLFLAGGQRVSTNVLVIN